MKHKMKQVAENLYECVHCGAEAEGWLDPLTECPTAPAQEG